MNSEPDWAAQAQQFQQFQQALARTGPRRLSSFQGMGTTAGVPAAPQLSFSPEKLQALQQAYLREAAELWNQGLKVHPATKDKRFASEAWAGNPDRLLFRGRLPAQRPRPAGPGRSGRHRCQDQGAAALCGRAVDGRLGAQQLHVPQRRGAEEGHRNQGREHRPGHAEPAQGHPAGPCVDDRRERVRGRQERGHHRRRRGVRERAVPADRIQAAHGQGLRAAVSSWCRPASTSSISSTCSPRTRWSAIWWSRGTAPSS